ncbi:hypothetical protein [Verrucomicrobium sp. BvORR034]|uniref:hypothetical protein n=1 Tax=Verrucomicrobium sp. BvORR034 TaxID=1396418 RepID=UPI002240F7C6|nr:hypothetical protein [Verrucomicrobium sp. BvORR034]
MPEVTAAQTKSLSEVINQMDMYGVGENAELRGKADEEGDIELYAKRGFKNPFGKQSVRQAKQNTAREMVGKAVDNEFDNIKPGGKFLASVVKKNMRSICEGTGVVTRGDLDKVMTEVNRVRDSYRAYTGGKSRHENNASYLEGKEQHLEVLKDVAGFEEGMELFKGIELYAKLINGPKPLSETTLKQMGAVEKWIGETSSDLSDVASLARANLAVDAAVDCGAKSIKVLPQDLPLRQIGSKSDQSGRCFPMVALAVLSESTGPRGMDQVVRRFEQETQKAREAGQRGSTPYSECLATVHGNGTLGASRTVIKDHAGKAIEFPGHRKTIQHLATHPDLAAGKPVFYGVEVHGHIMMVGATKHNGEDSFMFYDPNFGVARFETPEQLSTFLDKYFGDLGYGEEYSMENLGVDGFKFNHVTEYDVDKVKLAKVDELPDTDPKHMTMESLTKPL